ncbi:MAG: DUF3298 domain-containing protein [Bacteroidia bacterium]
MQRNKFILSFLFLATLSMACGNKGNANKTEADAAAASASASATSGSETNAAPTTLPKNFYKHLVGTINGNLNVVMDIAVADTAVHGSYYYTSKGQNIGLFGSFKNGKLNISESSNSVEDMNGKFEGTLSADGTFKGQWKNDKTKKSFAAELKETYEAGSVKAEVSANHVHKEVKVGKFKGEINVGYSAISVQNAALNTRILKALNQGKSYEDILQKSVKDSEADLKEFGKDMQSEEDYGGAGMRESEENVSIRTNEGNVLALESSGYEYAGGAHPNSFVAYENFNTATGDTIGLSQIFVPNFRPKLNAIAEKFLRKQNKITGSLADAGFEFEKGFQVNNNFSLERGGIRFLYNQYEIAPYAAGMPEFFIPYSELKGLINTSSPIGAWVK